jgi:hypothetical protein
MHKGTVPHIVSGDGDSAKTPIEFPPCDRETRIAAERAYITGRFGPEDIDWTLGAHFSRPDFISHWQIKLPGGDTNSVYFDASVSLEDE